VQQIPLHRQSHQGGPTPDDGRVDGGFSLDGNLCTGSTSRPVGKFLRSPQLPLTLLWDQTTVGTPEDAEWVTKQSNSNSEQMGNIFETWATFLFLEKDTTSIRLLLNSLIHIDGEIDRELLAP
jgi:hypothetical protein